MKKKKRYSYKRCSKCRGESIDMYQGLAGDDIVISSVELADSVRFFQSELTLFFFKLVWQEDYLELKCLRCDNQWREVFQNK